MITVCLALLLVGMGACAALKDAAPGSRREFWAGVVCLAAVIAVPVAAVLL